VPGPTCCRPTITLPEQVEAVELNPQVVDLVRRQFAPYAGGIYSGGTNPAMPRTVRVQVAEARGFVAASKQRYDLIHVALLDSFSASSAGLYALSENYLYTVQACRTICGIWSAAACWRSRAGSRCRRATRSSCSPPR
jgi:spermidine synthase